MHADWYEMQIVMTYELVLRKLWHKVCYPLANENNGKTDIPLVDQLRSLSSRAKLQAEGLYQGRGADFHIKESADPCLVIMIRLQIGSLQELNT